MYSCEIARSLGVTQKTAWFMLHRYLNSLIQRRGVQRHLSTERMPNNPNTSAIGLRHRICIVHESMSISDPLSKSGTVWMAQL